MATTVRAPAPGRVAPPPAPAPQKGRELGRKIADVPYGWIEQIAGMLILVLPLALPVRAPLAQARDYATVRAAIQARLNGSIDDPLIGVAPGVTARLSNVGGFTLNGYTYYYYREGQPGFDPMSRGAIAPDQVELVAHDEIGHATIVIYRVPSKDHTTN